MTKAWIRMAIAAALIAPLSGCYTLQKGMSETCDAASVQRYIGVRATGESGREIMGISGAKTLRWVAPGMAVTMDYRPDRLTVSYDEGYRITAISCG